MRLRSRGAGILALALALGVTVVLVDDPRPADAVPTAVIDYFSFFDGATSSISSTGPHYTDSDGRAFFSAAFSAEGYPCSNWDHRLWVADPEPRLVARFADEPEDECSSAGRMVAFQGGVLFAGTSDRDGAGHELYRSDGTSGSGTHLVKDIRPGDKCSCPRDFTPVLGGSKVVFAADHTDRYGWEPWLTDGSENGTALLADIAAELDDSNPEGFSPGGPSWFGFAADDDVAGRELFVSNGSGVTLIDIAPGSDDSQPTDLTSTGSGIVFAADDGEHGTEPWFTDGTAAGTVLLADINPGTADSDPTLLTAVGDQVFFRAQNPEAGAELWATDGTPEGTRMVRDILPGTGDGGPFAAITTDGRLYFSGNDGVNGTELWVSDGTEAGTTMLVDISPGSAASGPRYFAGLGDRFFFRTVADDQGFYVSDGTTAGTHRIGDVPARDVLEFTAVGDDTVWFKWYDRDNGWEPGRITIAFDGTTPDPVEHGLTEPLTVTDTTSIEVDELLQALADEQLTVTEAVTILRSLELSDDEAITVVDRIQVVLEELYGIDEGIVVADAIRIVLGLEVGIAEPLTVTDAASVQVDELLSALADERISVTDAVSVLLDLVVTEQEAIVVADAVQVLLEARFGPTQGIVVADAVRVLLGLEASSSEVLTIGDAVAVLISLGISDHQPVTVTDEVAVEQDSVQTPDTDGDGIADDIDGFFSSQGRFVPRATEFSDDFTDEHLAGTTSGSIIDRGGLLVAVTDLTSEVDTPTGPIPAGVRLVASGAAGSTAQVSVCDGSAVVKLTDGDRATVTCGSVHIHVEAGPIEVTLANGAVLSAETGVLFHLLDDADAGVRVLNDPSSTGDLQITHDGETTTLAPGSELDVNGSPRAVDDDYLMSVGPPLLDVPAPGVLHNDTDPDGDPLHVVPGVRSTQHGTVFLRADGSLRYLPRPGSRGIDSFTYTVCDPAERCDDGVVTIQHRRGRGRVGGW